MGKTNKRGDEEKRAKIRRRYTGGSIENAELITAKSPPKPFDDDSKKRVAVYTRFASPSFGSSDHELPKRHYSSMISEHSNWEHAGFYFDSVPANAYRPKFERMLSECRAGKIDLIVTPSLSRFAHGIIARHYCPSQYS